MSVDPSERFNELERARTDKAFEVTEPAQNPRIGPRVIPIVIAVVIGIIVIVLLFMGQGGM